MDTNTFNPALRHKIGPYWRGANDLGVGKTSLCDDPIVNEPPKATDHFAEGDLANPTMNKR